VAKNSLTIECSGSSEKINALIDMLKQFGIIEATRTGAIVLERGGKSIKNNNDI
jgi:acetolactate synthase I/III small subunit